MMQQRLSFRFPRREFYSTTLGEEEGGGGARFPPTWFLFPLGRGRARYPPEEKRSRGRTHSPLLSLFVPVLENRSAARFAAFSSYWVPRTWAEGGEDGYITLLQSLECFLVMKRPMFRAEEWRRRRRRRVGLSLC